MGFSLASLHTASDPIAALRQAQAICIAGGNTYHLNHLLHTREIRDVIRRRVLEDGIPFVGWSAGTNVAFEDIVMTNDNNIVPTDHFGGLGLIIGGVRLKPHFYDPFKLDDLSGEARVLAERLIALSPEAAHALKGQGESPADRIEEYLKLHPGPVIGLYEGGILYVTGPTMTLTGVAGAKIFHRGEKPVKYEPGADLSFLLRP